MIKNAFYFILKDLFVIKIFKISFWLFGHLETRLILKSITLLPWQAITIHILFIMLKECRFLFDLVLGLPEHRNKFCHVSWCEFLFYLDPLGVQMNIIVGILCNEAHELKDPALGCIFGWTFLDSFQHILSLYSDGQEFLHWASCQIWCFWLLAELVHRSCSSKFMYPLKNLAFQGMVVKVELTAKFCLYCFERFRLQVIRETIIFLIIYYKLFFPFPKVFDW